MNEDPHDRTDRLGHYLDAGDRVGRYLDVATLLVSALALSPGRYGDAPSPTALVLVAAVIASVAVRTLVRLARGAAE